MALQDYAQLKAFYNGSPIIQLSSISMQTDAGNQPIELLGEGLGGFTSGNGSVTIEIEFQIPIGGQEFDYQQDCANKAYVDLQIFAGRNTYAGSGKIMTHGISQSSGGATTGNFSWQGELKPFD